MLDMMPYWKTHQLPITAGVLLGLFVLWELRYVFVILFAAYLIAAAFLPAADFLGQRMHRAAAIILVYFSAGALLIGALVPAIQWAASQGPDFLTSLPKYLDTLTHISFLQSVDFSSIAASLQGHLLAAGNKLTSGFIDTIAGVIMSMYLLYDWHRIHERLGNLAGSHKHAVQEATFMVERLLGSWLRGQILLSAIVGVLVFIALAIYGLPFAPILGLIAGVFEIVPYAGPILAAIPAVLIGLGDSTTSALIVVGIYVIIDQAENHLLVPFIMKNAVHLHPTVVIFSILLGFETMGIIGALFSVPFVSSIWVIAKYAYQRRISAMDT
jgi:predicted PurR-regulated permease PerM